MQSPEPFISIIFGVCFVIIVLFFIGLWLWMLIDAFKREDWPSNSKDSKILWILVVFFAGWIGALLYYIIVYQKMKNNQNFPPSGPLGV